MKKEKDFLVGRREFLYQAGALTALSGLPKLLAQKAHSPQHQPQGSSHTLDANTLAKFVDPLPIPTLLTPNALRASPLDAKAKVPYYRLGMRQAEAKLHRDLKPTKFWGFNSTLPGPTIEVRRDQEILVEWVNELPESHLFTVDHNLEGAEADKPSVRAVVHLHGGRVPPESDGYPENWFLPGKSSVCFYPNNQEAATLWYHDHAMGINRLNMYAGLFGLYLIRDAVEAGLGLPAGNYEIPLILCDRQFDRDSQFYYPVSPDPLKPWVSEVFGDAALTNGKISPYLDVEARPYRFRVLNAANGRFFHLALANGQEFEQIGSDQGLLPGPVMLKRLTMAPGERADVIIDFSKNSGETIVLKSDTLDVMQIRVKGKTSIAVAAIPKVLRTLVRTPESEAKRTRELLLEETDDGAGNPTIMLLNRTRWMAPVTENPQLDSTEIWSFVNGTDDSHPIHLHLVRFQILDRQNFFVMNYLRKRELKFTGSPVPPDPNEMGWKDTVQAHAGMVTRVIVRFEGYVGRYVWHCHILEHGDNEMMRPYDVVAAT